MLQTILQLPVVTLIRVMLGVVTAFVLLPALVLPRPISARTTLDVTVVRGIRWLAIALFVSHLLVVVRLFHAAPILLLCAWLWFWTSGKSQTRTANRAGDPASAANRRIPPLQRVWLRFADIMHLFEQAGRGVLSNWWANAVSALQHSMRNIFSVRTLRVTILLVPIIAIVGTSLALRVEQSFRFETLSPPDTYIYLAWAKAFAANQLYVDGLYPMGLPAFIAFSGKLTPGIDLYELVRYTGAIIGMLTVTGIFYAVLRLSANVGAALFASGVFGLFGTISQWQQPWIRQTGPLPQELGFAIALFALPAAVLAITERDPDHLRTVGFASLAIGLIHPSALGLYLAMALAGAIAASVFTANGNKFVLGVGLTGALGGIIAHLYLPIGVLAGIGLFRGLDQPFSRADLPGSREEQIIGIMGTSDLGHNLFSMTAGGAALLAFVAAVLLARSVRTKRIGAQLAGLAAIGLVAVALYDPQWLQIPTNILGPLANIAGVGLTIAFAAGFAAITAVLFSTHRPSLSPVVRTSVLIVLAAACVLSFSFLFERGPRTRAPSEYASTAAVTREVMRSQDAFTYTLVGTPQQRQAVAGIGTFIELWVFARDVTVRDAQDPGFVIPDLSAMLFAADLGQSLPIPTTDTYIFVEKVPYPVPEQPPVGPTEEYYYNREKRGRIMAAVYAWAEFYRYYHTNMSVYFEDDDIIVYQISRRPNPVAAAAAPQFKDYTWQPGELFTGGPADPSEVVIPWHD